MPDESGLWGYQVESCMLAMLKALDNLLREVGLGIKVCFSRAGPWGTSDSAADDLPQIGHETAIVKAMSVRAEC